MNAQEKKLHVISHKMDELSKLIDDLDIGMEGQAFFVGGVQTSNLESGIVIRSTYCTEGFAIDTMLTVDKNKPLLNEYFKINFMKHLYIRHTKCPVSKVHKYPMSRIKFVYYVLYTIDNDFIQQLKLMTQ